MKHDFKVGDKIRYMAKGTNPEQVEHTMEIGKVYTVRGIDSAGAVLDFILLKETDEVTPYHDHFVKVYSNKERVAKRKEELCRNS